MGTLLYARGVFINRCYDELNCSQPEMIRDIHHEYLQAGAEVIETNTFGANAVRLARHGFAERVHEVNLAGAHLAREAAKSFAGWVAGSVGPLGIRIEPLGKTSREEARSIFKQQIAALAEGGVDLLILETFGYLEELHQALLAAREEVLKFRWWRKSPLMTTATAWMVPARKPLPLSWRNGAPMCWAATAASGRSPCWKPWNGCAK